MLIWREALTRFEAHLQQSGLARNTVAGYVRDMRGFSLWLEERAGPQASPGAFSSSDLEAYKCHLGEALGRSPSSINRCLQSARKFGSYAVAAGMREMNPARTVPLLEGTGYSATRTLVPTEVDRLVRVAEARCSRTAVRDRALLQLLVQTGPRISELVDLQISDVELGQEQSMLTIRGQGKRRDRRVPLSPAVSRALDAYLKEERPPEAACLFLGREGKPLSVRTAQKIVADLGKEAGLDVSTKMLRHTYAKSLWQSTRDLHLLTERLGHLRPETALKFIYPLAGEGSTTEVR